MEHGGSASQNRQEMHADHHQRMAMDFRRRFFIALAMSIPILLLSPMVKTLLGASEFLRFTGEEYLLWLFSTLLFIYGGRPFFKGFISETSARQPGMMTLVAVAITIAYTYSSAVVFGLAGKLFFWELATLIDIMLLGHWVEMRSVMGASRALQELARLMPSVAHQVDADGSVTDIPLDELTVSLRVLVRPGEKIPADGTVLEGVSAVDESLLTGESVPIDKEPGQRVIGGSLNGEGALTVQVSQTGEDSYLSKVIRLVSEAQQSRSRTQNLANRAALWLTIIAVSAGIVTLVVWLQVMRADLAYSLERTVTVMVTTCPHALGLAIPLVVAVSTAIAAQRGLLIRDRAAFEAVRNVDVVLFDKTGTLTLGKFGVTDVVVFDDEMSSAELLKMAASVETLSEHPIARGIVNAAPETDKATGFKSLAGHGVEASVSNQRVRILRPDLMEDLTNTARERLAVLTATGKTVVVVSIDGRVRGAIALADVIRPESKEAITELRKMGVRCMMLTGDREEVAQWVSSELGLDEYFAQVLPDKKAEKVVDVQKRGFTVAMTGDGVNDAPALAQADVGIAIGSGTDVAVETADIILVRNDPRDILTLVRLARATYRKMLQNLAWATGYNVVAIPLAAGVLYQSGIVLSPAAGAVLMSLSTVIVAVNARFLRL